MKIEKYDFLTVPKLFCNELKSKLWSNEQFWSQFAISNSDSIHSNCVLECPNSNYKSGKAFSTNSNLHKHHRNVHEKRKNNVCNFCSKAFGESSDLKKHIEWVHEGVKDKICDLCGMAFGHGHALKRHLRTVHEGIKDHVCNVCSKVRYLTKWPFFT